MNFPVDLLADTSQAELEQLAHSYMNDLLYSNPDSPEQLILSDSTQVTIGISSVGFIPLYGLSNKHKILALFAPGDPLTAVALYLLDQWWTVHDILKTADPTRDGAVEVETIGERIVLYVLNRVIYRAKEMSSEELPFLCHGENDHAKIFWNKGEAVGFYSVKPSGRLFGSSSTKSYTLPVMDSIFVRKCQRRKGFGLRMLDDFVLSFKEDCLGLRYPLTKSMYKVCEKYLCQYPKCSDRLWEVESIGGPHQRTNISTKIQALGLDAVSKSLSFTEKSLVITEVTETAVRRAGAMECTVEIVEEVTVLRAAEVPESELPVAAWGRSKDSKRRNAGEKTTANKSEKVIRVEDTEAETARDEQVLVKEKTELHDVSELVQTEDKFSAAPEEKRDDIVDTEPTMADKPATVLASQDLDEADVASVPQTLEPQIQDDATQDEDSEVLVISEDVLEVHKEVETLNKLGEGTQIEVTDEKSLKRVTQHVVSLSAHETSEPKEVADTAETALAEETGDEKVKNEKEQEGEEVETSVTRDEKEISGDESEDLSFHQRVEQERTADKTEEMFTEELTTVEKSTIPKEVEPTEDVIPLTEVNLEEFREVQENEEAEGGMETVSVLETNEKEEAADMIQEPGTVASETAPEVETVVAEVPQEKVTGSEIPKLQKATVILVDLKTTCHHLTLTEAEETPDESENAALEKEQVEPIAAEQTEVVGCVAEDPTSESEMLVLEEENGGENEKSIGKSEEASAEAVEKEQEPDNVDGEKSEAEEASFIETRVLRSERMSVKASHQEQREDNISEVTAEKCVDGDSEEELGVRRGRTSAVPKRKSRRTRKQIQKEEQEGAEESKSVEATEITPSVEEGKAVVEDGQSVMEEQSKVVGDEEVELPAIALTKALKSGGKASKAPPKNTPRKSKKQQDEKNEDGGASAQTDDGVELRAEQRSLRRGRSSVHKQPQKKEEGPRESAEEAVAEEEEEAGAGLGSAGQPPIKGDVGEAPEKDETEAQNEELVPVNDEKGVSEAGTMTITEDEENTAGVASAATSDEEATFSGEKQLSEESEEVTQPSDFQRVAVILVDLKKTQHEVQEQTESVEEDTPVAKIAAETEREKVEDAVTIQETGEEKAQEIVQEDEFKNICDEEKAPVVETKNLRSGEKKVAATARNKTTKGDKQEEEPAVETRILRKGRRCAATVPTPKCKRARTQCETEEEGGTLAEESQIDENMAALQDHEEKEENKDERTEESSEEEAASQKEENTEEAAGERSTEDEFMLETRVVRKRSAAVIKKHETEEEGDDKSNEMQTEETKLDVKEDNHDELEEKDANEHVSQEEENKAEAMVETVEEEPSAVSKADANEQEETPNTDQVPVVETRVLRSSRKSEKPTQRSKPAVETSIQRKERKSTPATPAKKVCTQHETEKEEETTITAEVNEGEEGIGQESPEEKEEEAEEEVESVKGKECAVGDAEEMKDDSLTEEAAVSDGEETDSDMVKVEKAKSAEEEEPTVTEESESAEVRSHTAIAGGGAFVASQSVMTEKEDTAGQGVVETQQEEEESPEDEETHEVHQLAEDSLENREISAEEQAETDTTSSTGQEVGPSAEDNVGDQAKEIADLLDNRLIEPPSEELTIEEMESREKEVPESKDNTLDSLVSVADKAEEIQLPQQKSIRKRTRMDYKENDEEEEGGESEASKEQGDNVKPKEDKDDKEAKCSADEPNLEETGREENTGNDAMHLEIETDEEEEAAGLSQDDMEDEQSMSEEEVESIVIGERVLRGRSIPLQIITPRSKSRRCSTKVQQSEMSSSDVDQSPQSAQKRSLRKRKSTEVTPTHKSKRHSRV